jgi:hypothetical protein
LLIVGSTSSESTMFFVKIVFCSVDCRMRETPLVRRC